MKLCRDCKHYRAFLFSPRLSKCAAFLNPIDGTPAAFCGIEREGGGFRTACGAQGHLWEPKPKAWWQFWK